MKKNNSTIKNQATPILLSLFSAGLAGCSSNTTVAPTTVSGTAVKGLLKNAEAFVDTDGDGAWTSGVDSDKVRTAEDGSFSIVTDLTGDIVVQTDEITIDASSGAVLAGITMSAMAGSSVVSVATTITNELVDAATTAGNTLSQADAESQVKAILGISTTVDVASYNPYASANAGSTAAVEFEKAAQQVMTVINTLAEAEATTNIGTSVSKSAAISNAITAFVDVVEAKVVDAGTGTVASIDFTAATIIDEVVAAAVTNDSNSVFNDTSFTDSLTAIKTAIKSVNTAIDSVTSLDAGSKQTFAVAQTALIDMTQSVASSNDDSKATIDINTTVEQISKMVVVNGTTSGILTEDDAKASNDNGSLVLKGAASIIDPDASDNVSYTFSTTVTTITSDSANGSALGSLTITSAGVWTYTVDDSHADVQALGVKDSLTEVFQVKTIATDATDPENPVASDSTTKYIRVKISGSNDAPTLTEALADTATAEDAAFTLNIPKTLITDLDSNDSHKVTATLENGDTLSEWLTLTSHSSGDNIATLAGTPLNSDVGAINITLTYSDGNAKVSDTFTLTVTNTNDTPTLANAQDNQTTAEDSAFSYTIPTNTFADVDTNDTNLTITATGLPDGLTLTDGVISGTPTNAVVGNHTVTITATDSSNATVTDEMVISVTNTNDAPTVATAQTAQQVSENVAFNYVMPASTFADVDADTSLTYSATLANGDALPTWLTFNAGTATFSGTPASSDVAVLSITVTANDGVATVSDTLALTVTENAIPTVANAQDNLTATEDSAFSYTVPTNTFADTDANDTNLTITAEGLPEGLTFTNGEISGTTTNAAVGDTTVSIIATDTAGASVTDQIVITVANTNDAPTVANDLVDQTIISGRESTYTIASNSFADVDASDTLTYSATLASGADLPSWLLINSTTGTLTANPTASDTGSISVTVTATDSASSPLTASDTFAITVAANQAPVVSTLADQTATEDSAISFSLADASFTDGNGDGMTVTVAGEPAWLTYDANTKTFSGTPTNESHAGTSTITVTATDASGAAGTDTFDLVTTAVNDSPVMAASSAVTVTENTFLAATLSATDEESDTISYAVTGGADQALFGINTAGDGLVFTSSGSARSDMRVLLDSAGAQGGLLVDNLTTTVSGSATTLKMDLLVMPKVVNIEALKGIQFTPTSTGTAADFDFYFSSSSLPKKHDQSVDDEGDPLVDADGNAVYDTVTGSGGLNGAAAIWYSDSSYSTNDMEATKIGILKISNYDASNTYTIDTLLMGGGDAGSSTSANYTLNNLTISSVADLPDYGDNASAAGSDNYSVEVTATDATGNTTVQNLTVTLSETTANSNSSTTTATWTGTSAADTYTIDSLAASANGGDGDNDLAKLSIENHTTWDTTGGTSELAATLVDMEIIDIGNIVTSNDSTAVTIADFSTNMTIDATSAASLIAGSDSQVSIMGTNNDIVTLSGTSWVKGAESSLSAGGYASQARDAWTDGTSTLYIDQDINIVTPDIA